MARALAEHRVSENRRKPASTHTSGSGKNTEPPMTVPDAVILLAVIGESLKEHCLPEHLRGLPVAESRRRILDSFEMSHDKLDELIKLRRRHNGVMVVGPILWNLFKGK